MDIQTHTVTGGISFDGGTVEVGQVHGPITTAHGTYDYPHRAVSVHGEHVYDTDTGQPLPPNR